MKIVLAPKVLIGDPEANAMMQAFYSRSKRGIEDRLAETTLDLDKIKHKLSQFFVGYGHDSIGQCGYVTFFIEGVSILADKAIQDCTLYNGQESSTRYIDFSKEPVYVPIGSKESMSILQDWISFYYDLVQELQTNLARRNEEGTAIEDLQAMEKACRVKAFDIASAFLPCGVTTNLSWTVSLATLNRELLRLAGHQLTEVREIADRINAIVKEQLPSIYVPFEKRQAEIDVIRAESEYSYSDVGPEYTRILNINHCDVIAQRQRHDRLPHKWHSSYLMSRVSTLDYRSFRDVQRHRPLNPSSPLVELKGFHSINEWYIDALDELGIDYSDRLEALIKRVASVDLNPFEKQYLCPMGTNVRFSQSGYLGDWLYYAELRTGETVHPTVRLLAHEQWSVFERSLDASVLRTINPRVKEPSGLLDISFKRAAQDIIQKV